MKRTVSDPFGPQHPLTFTSGAQTTISLSAGWDTNDDWRGFEFQIQVAGDNVHVISAWMVMEGLDRFQCPMMI